MDPVIIFILLALGLIFGSLVLGVLLRKTLRRPMPGSDGRERTGAWWAGSNHAGGGDHD